MTGPGSAKPKASRSRLSCVMDVACTKSDLLDVNRRFSTPKLQSNKRRKLERHIEAVQKEHDEEAHDNPENLPVWQEVMAEVTGVVPRSATNPHKSLIDRLLSVPGDNISATAPAEGQTAIVSSHLAVRTQTDEHSSLRQLSSLPSAANDTNASIGTGVVSTAPLQEDLAHGVGPTPSQGNRFSALTSEQSLPMPASCHGGRSSLLLIPPESDASPPLRGTQRPTPDPAARNVFEKFKAEFTRIPAKELPTTFAEFCQVNKIDPKTQKPGDVLRSKAMLLAQELADRVADSEAASFIGGCLEGADTSSNLEGLGSSDVDIFHLLPRTWSAYTNTLCKVCVLAKECVRKRESIPGFLEKIADKGDGVIFSENDLDWMEEEIVDPLTIRLHFNRIVIVTKKMVGVGKHRKLKWVPSTTSNYCIVIFNEELQGERESNSNWRIQSDTGVMDHDIHAYFAGLVLAFFGHFCYHKFIPKYREEKMYLRMVRVLMTLPGTAWQMWHRDLVTFLTVYVGKKSLRLVHSSFAKFWMGVLLFGGTDWLQYPSEGFWLKWLDLKTDEKLVNEEHTALCRFTRVDHYLMSLFALYAMRDELVKKAQKNKRSYMPPDLPDWAEKYEQLSRHVKFELGTSMVGVASAPHAGANRPRKDSIYGITACRCDVPMNQNCAHQNDENCLALPVKYLQGVAQCCPRYHVVSFRNTVGDAFNNIATPVEGYLTNPVHGNVFHDVEEPRTGGKKPRMIRQRVDIPLHYERDQE